MHKASGLEASIAHGNGPPQEEAAKRRQKVSYNMQISEARPIIRSRWREIMPMITGTAKAKANHEQSYTCPFCGHGSGGDGLTYNPKSQDGNGLKCFGCGWSGDIIDLYQQTTNKSHVEAVTDLASQIGIAIDSTPQTGRNAPKNDFNSKSNVLPGQAQKPAQNAAEATPEANYTEYYGQCAKRITDPAAVSYLQGRGISLSTAKAAFIGFDPAADPANAPGGKVLTSEEGQPLKTYPAPRIIIPTTPAHYTARSIDPNTGKTYRKMNCKGGSPGIFNAAALYSEEQEVFVTEGAFDALSVMETGAQAIAINSTANAGQLLKQLESSPTEATLILCLDSDEAGKKAQETLAQGLNRINLAFIAFDINGGCKDANEHLTANRPAFFAAVQEARKAAAEYRTAKDTEAQREEEARAAERKAAVDLFLLETYTQKYKPVPTGINAIDEALNGGLIPQTLVFLGAEPGAGKTALATQIFETMARAGHSAVYYNLEMSRQQLLARSIARIIYGGGTGPEVGALDILQGYKQNEKTRRLVQMAAQDYKDSIAPYLDYNPGNGSPDLDSILESMNKAADHAEKAKQPAPNICIDYLQLLTGHKGEEAGEIIKRAVAGFKDYARKHDAIVFCIMAQSRAVNKSKEATQQQGRDSSAIEYSGDLQLQLTSEDAKTKKLHITKSRFTQTRMNEDGISFYFKGGQSYFQAIESRYDKKPEIYRTI